MAIDQAVPASHLMTPQTISSFLRWEQENGASENMLRRYKGAAKVLYRFLPDDKTVTKERLLAWRSQMEDSGYAPQTILNYVKYINRYLDRSGCPEIRFNRGRGKDLRDRTFGLLTAIEPTEKRNRGDIVWRCKCACGTVTELPATRLLRGNTTSCGCLQTQMRKDVLRKANKCFAGTNLNQVVKEKVVSDKAVSGYVGVAPKRDKWQAYITYRGRYYSLGCYHDIQDAVKARARAKELAIQDAKSLIDFYDALHQEKAIQEFAHYHV